MGASYGSIHFRTVDRASVRELLSIISRKTKTRFYLAPAINGWTSTYPSDRGQDERIAKRIAKSFDGELLQVIVHDDDIFAYAYFRNGEQLDNYNSQPNYFGNVSARQKEKLRGKPAQLAHLLKSPDELLQLEQVLWGSRPTFASESLLRFADMLVLPNAQVTYESLAEGEVEDIQNLDQWIHIPDLSRERSRQRKWDGALEVEKEALLERGILLLEQKADTKTFSSPIWFPNPVGRGFFVYWSIFNRREPSPLLRYAPPYSASPTMIGLELSEVSDTAMSPSGRYLAVPSSVFPASVRVLEMSGLQDLVQMKIQHSRIAIEVAFSPDEKLLATLGDELIITRVPSGERIAISEPSFTGAHLSFHPSNAYLVLGLSDRLTIVNTADGSIVKSIYAGGVEDFAFLYQLMGRKLQHEMQEADSKKDAITQTDLAQQQIHEMISALSGGRIPGRQNGLQGRHRLASIKFTPDGKRMLCCSDHGLHVYDWNEVLESMQTTPEPVFIADPPQSTRTRPVGTSNYCYDCVVDPTEDCVIFAGLGGIIYSLSLVDGAFRVLLNLPGNPPVIKLDLSRDRSALACTTRPEMFKRGGGDAQVLQIFSYPDLLR